MEASPGSLPDQPSSSASPPCSSKSLYAFTQIPPVTTYYSVLDLKDAFFAFPYTLNVNLSLPLRTPQESLDRSLGLSYPRDSETAPTSLG
jgi:hypothetical protein